MLLSFDQLNQGLVRFTRREPLITYRLHDDPILGYYTPGVQYLIDYADSGWLLIDIFGQQSMLRQLKAFFQVWKLDVYLDGRAVLMCENGDKETLFSKPILATSFPLPCFTLYVTYEMVQEQFLPILLLTNEA